MHTSQHIISETYLDSFGHVNHARYLELYEQARWNWMADAGLSIEDIKRTAVGPVILNANVSYRRELKGRDQITIETQISEDKGKIFTIAQRMLLPDGSVASEVAITAGMMDLKARKLIEPPTVWREVFGIAK